MRISDEDLAYIEAANAGIALRDNYGASQTFAMTVLAMATELRKRRASDLQGEPASIEYRRLLTEKRQEMLQKRESLKVDAPFSAGEYVGAAQALNWALNQFNDLQGESQQWQEAYQKLADEMARQRERKWRLAYGTQEGEFRTGLLAQVGVIDSFLGDARKFAPSPKVEQSTVEGQDA